MSENVLCPICETENPAEASHCEVCGERLTPLEPGEEASPEENVSQLLAEESEGSVVGFSVEDSDGDGDDEDFNYEVGAPDDDGGEFDAVEPEDGDSDAAQEVSGGSEDAYDDADAGDDPGDDAHEAGDDEHDAGDDVAGDDEYDAGDGEYDAGDVEYDAGDDEFDAGDDEFDAGDAEYDAGDDGGDGAPPTVLYSPIDGTAYPEGTPEYEEGYGPSGEELVAEPPAGLGDEDGPATDEMDADPDADQSGEAPRATAPAERSAEFAAAFQAKQKARQAPAPLPQPGQFTTPAKLTVFVNRAPVAQHAIETDETLIGRRDPVADAYPDVDLTDHDPEAFVSRKHAYVYRQNKNYTLYVVSNAGTQLNAELLDIGDRRPLTGGDVIVLAGKIAVKFDLPNA